MAPLGFFSGLAALLVAAANSRPAESGAYRTHASADKDFRCELPRDWKIGHDWSDEERDSGDPAAPLGTPLASFLALPHPVTHIWRQASLGVTLYRRATRKSLEAHMAYVKNLHGGRSEQTPLTAAAVGALPALAYSERFHLEHEPLPLQPALGPVLTLRTCVYLDAPAGTYEITYETPAELDAQNRRHFERLLRTFEPLADARRYVRHSPTGGDFSCTVPRGWTVTAQGALEGPETIWATPARITIARSGPQTREKMKHTETFSLRPPRPFTKPLPMKRTRVYFEAPPGDWYRAVFEAPLDLYETRFRDFERLLKTFKPLERKEKK